LFELKCKYVFKKYNNEREREIKERREREKVT